MTTREVAEIITLLQVEYPQSFTKMDSRQMQAKITLWADEFQNDDREAVYAAVRTIISGSGREFAPNIGQIREKMAQNGDGDVLSESEAWALVSKACASWSNSPNAVFEALPPTVRRAVGSAGQLREWSMVDNSEFHTVIASNFKRAYRVISERERETAKLPKHVRALISGMVKEAPGGWLK